MSLLVLSHVDDLASDDCVEVTQRAGYLPEGVTVADLDRDMDGFLDPDLSFDYGTGREHDPVACSIGGVVHARFPPTTRTSPVGGGEVTADRGNADAEHGEAREVDARGEQREVLLHAFAPSHASTAPAVLASHEMGNLALDPGPHLSDAASSTPRRADVCDDGRASHASGEA